MKKLFSILTMLMAFIGIQAQELAPGQMWWGNYSNQQTSLTGNSKLGSYEVAMFVAGDGDLKGVEISGARMQTRLYSNAKDVKIWVRSALDGENLVEKTVENPASSGWCGAKFDAPITLPESGAYVGYSFTLASWYSDYDYTPVVRGSKVVAGGLYLKQPDETEFSDKSATGCATTQIIVSGSNLKTNVASIADDMDDIVALKGSTVKVNATVTSQGTAGISSLDYTYTLDGASHNGHIDLDTPFGQMFGEQKTFEIELGAPTQLGTQECEIQITKVNGQANENTSVRKTKASVNINVLAESAPRTAVAEIYVGPSKPYSARGLVGAEQLAKAMGDNVIPVVVQSYDSPLVTPEYKAYQQYADGKLRFTSYPQAEINREFTTDPYFGSSTTKPYHFTANTVVEPTLNAVTEGAVSATATWADDAKTTVKISAKANFTGSFSGAAYRLGFMVIADGIKQDFSNYITYYKGDYPDDDMEFWRNSPYSSKDITVNNMVVASTDVTGISKSIPSTIAAGTDYTYELELPLNQFEGQTPENFRVVALLLNNDKKTIVNAALAPLAEETVVPVESVSILDPGNEVADGQTFIFENLGESYQFTAVVTPENATNKNVTWEVLQDSEVVTCEEGLVTLVGYGKAAVVVTTEDGEKQAYVNIFVQEKEPEKEPTTFEITNDGLDVTITPSNDNDYSYAIVIPEIVEALGKTDRNELFDDLANMFFNVVSGEVTFNVLEDYLEYAGLEELAPGTEVEVLVSNVKKEDGEIVREGEITTYTFTYGEGGDEADNVEWDPAPGEIDYNIDGHLDQVILTFTDAGMVEVNDIPFKANIEDETGREVDSMYGVNFYFLGWNQACITFNKGVTADGTYTVNVPAGLFTLTMPDGTTKASSELHATYIVTGAGEGPAPGGKMQILPAEGNVTSLQQFTLVINDWDSQFDSYNSKAQFYKDGELVEEVEFDYNPDDWSDPNLYGSLSAPVTEDGTYTLEFPVGSMTTDSWATSNTEPVVYTWTIGEGGGEEELPIGTYAEPIALEDGKTYGLNAAETGMPNFYTFESDKDVKVILTPTEGSIVEGGFAVSTGNFLMDDQYNDLEGAEMVETMMEPVESGEPGIGGDDELGGDDFGWGMAPGRMATTWTAKAGVKYYIMTMGQGSFDVALDEPEEYVGTMETPINLNETTEWTWGTDGKLPGSTTYYTYTAEKDGNLTVFVSNCAENQLYVGEDGWYDPYLHTEGPAYTGEIKTDYNWGAWTETNTFAVEAGTTYYITIFDLYDETIKVSFEDATGISVMQNAECRMQNAYNIRGQKVDADTFRGIVIKNGKKVIVK